MEENKRNFQSGDGDIGEFFNIPTLDSDDRKETETKEEHDPYNQSIEQASGEEEIDLSSSFSEVSTPNENYESLDDDDDFSKMLEGVRASGDVTDDGKVITRKEIALMREASELEKAKQKKSDKVIIEGSEIVKEFVDEGLKKLDETSPNAKRIREYKNEAVYYKSKFAKAQEENDNPLKGIIVMIIMATAGGIFGGVQANSYYVMQAGKAKGVLNCAFSWIMSADTLTVRMSPFYVDIFFGAFAIWGGALALVFLFSYFNNKTMKKSRVGHEHGNAKLMDSKSFNKYKNRFMEG